MRMAKRQDFWRHTDSRKGFPLWIEQVLVKGVEGFDDLDIRLHSGVSVLCGRSGTGKSTLLKIIYRLLSGDESFSRTLFERLDISGAEVLIKSSDGNVVSYTDGTANNFEKVNYFDPAALSVLVVQRIFSDSNVRDWIEGVDANQVLNDRLSDVRRVTGKKYSRVDVFEVSGVLEHDEVLPYISVCYRGNTYTNESMGLGEHKMLIMLWKLFTLERKSVLLVEEPEAFLCPRSQVEFMDVVAQVSCNSHSLLLMSSHSEHIVSKVSLDSNVIMQESYSKGFSLVGASHHYKYLSSLGLSLPKTGCLLVEDGFAGYVLSRILLRNDSFVYHAFHIAVQDGESNIEKLIKHYQEKASYKLIGVFDADYRGKINEENYFWPICFLPGEDYLPPEQLVINDFRARIPVYAEKLNLDVSVVSDALSLEVDHHDFFIEISKLLKVGLSTLKEAAVDLWLDEQSNGVEEFLFALENFGSKVTASVEGEGDEHFINVADKLLYSVHGSNYSLDLNKLSGKKLTGYVQYSNGVPVYRILNEA
ncbi:MAG: AAA family ATPase [Pseudomonadales bacterium]